MSLGPSPETGTIDQTVLTPTSPEVTEDLVTAELELPSITEEDEESINPVTKEYLEKVARSKDVDEIKGYLAKFARDSLTKDAALQQRQLGYLDLVVKVLVEKHPDKPELVANCVEVKKLIEKIPELLGDFAEKIKEIKESKEAGFSKIDNKFADVIESVIGPVLEGHLTAEDIGNLVRTIQITDKPFPTVAGYAPDAFYIDGHIVIQKNILKDHYAEGPKDLMTHELAHPVIEQHLLQNPEAMKLLRKLTETKEYSFIHPFNARVNCDNLANIDADYEKPENKSHFGSIEEYRKFRKERAVTEVAADYMSVFLQSNGELGRFVQEAVRLATKTTRGRQDFISNFKMEYYQDGKNQGKINFNKLMKNESFKTALKIYKAVFDLLSSDISQIKGKVTKEESDEELDLERLTENFGFYDSVPSPENDRREGQHQGHSLYGDLKDFVGAFAEETAGEFVPK